MHDCGISFSFSYFWLYFNVSASISMHPLIDGSREGAKGALPRKCENRRPAIGFGAHLCQKWCPLSNVPPPDRRSCIRVCIRFHLNASGCNAPLYRKNPAFACSQKGYKDGLRELIIAYSFYWNCVDSTSASKFISARKCLNYATHLWLPLGV